MIDISRQLKTPRIEIKDRERKLLGCHTKGYSCLVGEKGFTPVIYMYIPDKKKRTRKMFPLKFSFYAKMQIVIKKPISAQSFLILKSAIGKHFGAVYLMTLGT